MALLTRRRVFAAKTEAGIGTAETLAGADAVYNALEFSIQRNMAMTRREGQGGFNYLASVPEMQAGTATIRHNLTYDGTNIPAWASVLLPACGWVDTAGVFSPISRGPGGVGLPKTITIGEYVDGKLRRLSGCMGTFVITLETGKAAEIEFTFQGKFFENETDATILAPTYPTAPALRFANGTLTWAAGALCTSSATIDAGNEVILRECAETGNRTGIKSALVTNRAPIITADPEAVLVATVNRELQWTAGTTGVLAATLAGVGDSTLVISAPAAQIEDKQKGDRNGMVTDDITWLCTAGATPDSELTITFNADST
jgi:hypothetical protein